jgi:hypothetical protein
MRSLWSLACRNGCDALIVLPAVEAMFEVAVSASRDVELADVLDTTAAPGACWGQRVRVVRVG